MRILTLLCGAAAATLLIAPAMAADHVVKMLNKGAAGTMVFEPALLKIAPGDSVTFLSVDKIHNAESIPGMLPPGTTPFKGQMSQSLKVKFSTPGVYGYKCLPHYGMGMVGVVIVGSAVNLDAARTVSQPGRAKQAMAALLSQVPERTAAR